MGKVEIKPCTNVSCVGGADASTGTRPEEVAPCPQCAGYGAIYLVDEFRQIADRVAAARFKLHPPDEHDIPVPESVQCYALQDMLKALRNCKEQFGSPTLGSYAERLLRPEVQERVDHLSEKTKRDLDSAIDAVSHLSSELRSCLRLGLRLQSLDSVQTAELYWVECVHLYPKDGAVRFYYANFLLYYRRNKHAAFHEAMRACLNPPDVETLYWTAVLACRVRELDELSGLLDAMRKHPDFDTFYERHSQQIDRLHDWFPAQSSTTS